MSALKNSISQLGHTLFGELRAKQSQDNKPHRVLAEACPDRFSQRYALWSHSSLRSRLGMRLSQAWPLLSRLFLAPLIPARPFGLRLRFDEAHSVTHQGFAPNVYQPRNERVLARIDDAFKRMTPNTMLCKARI